MIGILTMQEVRALEIQGPGGVTGDDETQAALTESVRSNGYLVDLFFNIGNEHHRGTDMPLLLTMLRGLDKNTSLRKLSIRLRSITELGDVYLSPLDVCRVLAAVIRQNRTLRKLTFLWNHDTHPPRTEEEAQAELYRGVVENTGLVEVGLKSGCTGGRRSTMFHGVMVRNQLLHDAKAFLLGTITTDTSGSCCYLE
mgnify:CR=1 FL=1